MPSLAYNRLWELKNLPGCNSGLQAARSKHSQIPALLHTALAFSHSRMSHLLSQLHILFYGSSQEPWVHATFRSAYSGEVVLKKAQGILKCFSAA